MYDKTYCIDLKPIELNYYPFMISLDKCNGSYDAVNDSYTNIVFQRDKKRRKC